MKTFPEDPVISDFMPPNVRISKAGAGNIVWILDTDTGNALSATFVPDAICHTSVDTPINSEFSANELSGFSHVSVHNPVSSYDHQPFPLRVWVMNK